MNPISNLEQLFGFITDKSKIVTSPELLLPYTKSEGAQPLKNVKIVLCPSTTAEVSQIMKVCQQHKLSVAIRGGGTNVTRAVVPSEAGIIISLAKMNKLLSINAAERYVTVEAGASIHQINEAVLPLGLCFPQNMGTVRQSQIGGNIATSAGSPNSLKYGTIKDYVLNLEVVLADGTIMETGNNLSKSASGFNLTTLFVGSEGTLGIITKAVLKLVVPAKFEQVARLGFTDVKSAFAFTKNILAAGISPVCIEFADYRSLDILNKAKGQNLFDLNKIKAVVWLKIEADVEILLQETLSKLKTQATQFPNTTWDVPLDQLKQRHLMEQRMQIGFAIKNYSSFRDVDLAVPLEHLLVLYHEVEKIAGACNFRFAFFGHIGNGNPHINILKENMTTEEWASCLEKALPQIYNLVPKLGGVVSGEHGIGVEQKPYFYQTTKPDSIAIMKKIKQVFDPNLILNKDVLFDNSR